MIERVFLAGLMKLELPDRPILLCDGGVLAWNGDVYAGADPDFGTIAGFEALTEGVGDEAPAGTITMLPPSTAAAAEISRPGYQGSRLRLWIAEVNADTGAIIGEPDLQCDWQLDRTTLRIGRGVRELELGCVTRSQRLLARSEGNVLSSSFHARLYPGERGHDNAVGLEASFAWGVASAPRGVVASGAAGVAAGGSARMAADA